MDVSLWVAALKDKPAIFNADQGSQFTNAAFPGTLAAADIRIVPRGVV